MKAEALKTVLILGARGRFGLAATRAFAAAGWRVVAHYLWQTPHALAGDRLAALIGPEPHTPLPVALRETLHDLGLLPQPAAGAPACA